MKEYTITKKGTFDSAPKADISIYKWVDNTYRPKAFSQLMYDSKCIYVRHTAYENEITVKATKFQGEVWKDSCMEFFVRIAGDKRYLNFETNAHGVMLLNIGTDRDNRTPPENVNPDIFELTPSYLKDGKWTLDYKIPFSFLRSVYGNFSISDGLYGNFYKCGDETKYEHYGMWNEIPGDVCDFHLPQYFGRIWFEE